MGTIRGYAFQDDEKKLSKENHDRYVAIKHLAADITIAKYPKHGHVDFDGTLNTEEAQQLSEKDIALLADHGNLCFGGSCTKNGNKFRGDYSTD